MSNNSVKINHADLNAIRDIVKEDYPPGNIRTVAIKAYLGGIRDALDGIYVEEVLAKIKSISTT